MATLDTDTGAATGRAQRRWPLVVAAGLVLGVHVFGALRYFGSWHELTSADPILCGDHAHHYYYCELTKHFLSERGTTWGYDPNFMGGYPKSILFPSSSTFYEVAAWALGGVPTAAVYKFIVLVTAVIGVGGSAVGARLLGADARQTAWAVLAGFAYFWSGFPQRMLYWGMVSMVLAGAFYPVCLALLVRQLERTTWRRVVASCVLCAWVSFVHPSAAIALAGPYLAGWIWLVRRRRVGALLAYSAVPVVAFAANAFWILPGFRLTGEFGTTRVGYMTHLDLWSVVRSNVDVHFVCLVFGLGGLVVMARGVRSVVLGTAGVCLFLLAFNGNWLPWLETLQPARYGLFLYGTLLVSAGWGITGLWSACAAAPERRWRLAARVAVVGLCVKVLAWPAAYQFGLMAAMAPLPVEPTASNAALTAWLSANAGRAGRVAFEDSRGYQPGADPTDGQHILALLPLRTRAEFIGGPYFMAHVRQRFAQFIDGTLCDRPLATMDRTTFREYARLYNLAWMVCWSDPARGFADRHGDLLEHVEQIGAYRIYRLKRTPSFVYRGTGDVSAQPDTIRVRNLKPEDGEAVLCYHYIPTLRTRPEVRIEPVHLADDPSPFIRLVDPPAEVEIYNAR